MKATHSALSASLLCLLCLLSVSGCEAPIDDEARVETHAAALMVGAPRPDALANQWVGRRLGMACPPGAGGWVMSEPFLGLAAPGGANLPRICQYTWSAAPPANPANLPPESGRPQWLVQDTNSVRSMGTTLDAYLRADMNQIWREAAGASTMRALPAPSVAGHRVAVAVLDSCSASGGCPSTDLTIHAHLTKRIIESVTCASGACTADVLTEHAISKTFDGTHVITETEGGSFGTQTDLARSIMQAVDTWLSASVDRPLILNLSLGWQRKFGTQAVAPFEELIQPSVLVAEALRYARCHGALTFVASGNRTLDDETDGMLLPAAWTDLQAPDPIACLSIIGAAPVDPVGVPVAAQTGSLLFAVSGTTPVGDPLGSARKDSRASLLAPGNQIVADAGATFSEALSGSSAATAIASGAAAVLWRYRPNLDAATIADLLYNTGTTRDIADRASRGMPDARSINLCSALQSACTVATIGACPSTLPFCSSTPTTVPTFAGLPEVDVAWDETHDAHSHGWARSTMSTPHASHGAHGAPTLKTIHGSPMIGLPEDAPSIHAEQHVWPQPIIHLCPTCAMLDGSKALIRINPDLKADLKSPALISMDKSAKMTVTDLSGMVSTMTPGKSYYITGLTDIAADLYAKGATSVILTGKAIVAGKTISVAADMMVLD